MAIHDESVRLVGRGPNAVVAVLFGEAFLIIGLLGFTVSARHGAMGHTGGLAGPFQLNVLHNVFHLTVGAVMVGVAIAGGRSAKTANIAVGAVYLLLGLAGPLILGDNPLNLLALNSADNYLHVSLGVVLLAAGLVGDRAFVSGEGLATRLEPHAGPRGSAKDDKITYSTRLLAALITPFLLVAFPVLYIRPHDGGKSFAWNIEPSMTAMVLGSAYLGGAYFFVRVIWEKRWHSVKTGFLSVALFASFLGIATIIHWDKFNHHHLAFRLWVGLYFTAPFLVAGVWLANRARESKRSPAEVLLPPVARKVIGATGLLATGVGVFLFLAPAAANALWPWPLSPLTGRVIGAVFCLGLAGVGVFVDSRWTTARLMLQTETVMVLLILIAAARAHAELRGRNPLTWTLLGGLTAVLVGSVALQLVMRARLASAGRADRSANTAGAVGRVGRRRGIGSGSVGPAMDQEAQS